MKQFRKSCLLISALSAITLLIGIITGNSALWQPAAVALSVSASIGIAAIPALANYQYTAWIITAVVAGMIYPAAFLKWGDFDLRNKWLLHSLNSSFYILCRYICPRYCQKEPYSPR